MTHTPGPWEVEDGYSIIARPDANGWRLLIASTDSPNSANARLIAAAPDLLAALREIADKIDRESGGPCFTASEHDALVALIAKAEGKQ